MDNSTDAINNKLKAVTTDYSNKQQTEAYLIEKNKNLCIYANIYYLFYSETIIQIQKQ